MAEDFAGVTPDARHLVFHGQSREIPLRGFSRPAPTAISEANPFYLPDVAENEWAWDAQHNEWVPNPAPLAQAGISPPSQLTMFMMSLLRRAHLLAKDEIFRMSTSDAWPIFQELTYVGLHLALRNLQERRAPREIVQGHFNLAGLLLALESQLWTGDRVAMTPQDQMADFEGALRRRDQQYKGLKVHADLKKCKLSAAVRNVLAAAAGPGSSSVDPQSQAVMMHVIAHNEIVAVSAAVRQVPAGIWGPEPRQAGQQFSDDGRYYWDGRAWQLVPLSADQRSYWAGNAWLPLPSGSVTGEAQTPTPHDTDDPVDSFAAALLALAVSILDTLQHPGSPDAQEDKEAFKEMFPDLNLDTSTQFDVVSEALFYECNMIQRLLARSLSNGQMREAIPAICFSIFDRLVEAAAPGLAGSPDFEDAQAAWVNRNYERNEFYGKCRIGADDKGSMSGDLTWEASKHIVAAAGAGSWAQLTMPIVFGTNLEALVRLCDAFAAAYSGTGRSRST